MRKRKPESSDIEEGSAARGQSSGPSRAGRLTPLDIQQIEFRRSFKGYDEREVDEFLDRLTEDFAAALDEAQRLRDRAEGGLGAVVTGGTEAGSRRTADEIIQRARDDAARIVREAQERATAIGAAALGTGTAREGVAASSDRATIAPFIAKEREFLTSLATLVQGHAEAVRGMASSAQRAGEAAPNAPATRQGESRPPKPATGPGSGRGAEREAAKPPGQRAPEPRRAPAATPGAPSTPTTTPSTTTPSATPATAPATQPPPAATPGRPPRRSEEGSRPAGPTEGSSASGGSTTPTPPGEGHVTIPEPDPAGAKRGDHKLAEGDPSLRELFWGEE
jgi:DivIVA domain-containing protein